MPGLPVPVAKVFAYKKESGTWGSPAAGGSGAQLMRRIEAMFETESDTMESDEVAPTFQTTDVSIGQQRAKGTLRGRFSGKTWQDFIAAMCRQAFQTAPTTGALTNVTAAIGPITFTRAAGSYITDGFRVYDVVNWTGWATTGVANNSRHFLITSLTATVMTGVFLDGTAGGAKASGDSVTCTLAGKKTWIPQTGHTKDLFSFEEYHPDMTTPESELFYNMYVNTATIAQDPKGYMGFDIAMLGRAQQNQSSSPYFTTPTAVTANRLHNVLDGVLYAGGVAVADVTGLTINLDHQAELGPPVYGSRYPGDVAPGRIKVGGNFSCLFRDKTLRDNYLNRTKFALVGVSRVAQLAQSESAVIVLPSITLLTAPKTDGQSGFVSRQYNFIGDNNVGGSGSDQTSFSFQDTQAT